jgi:hypothetical protein
MPFPCGPRRGCTPVRVRSPLFAVGQRASVTCSGGHPARVALTDDAGGRALHLSPGAACGSPSGTVMGPGRPPCSLPRIAWRSGIASRPPVRTRTARHPTGRSGVCTRVLRTFDVDGAGAYRRSESSQ